MRECHDRIVAIVSTIPTGDVLIQNDTQPDVTTLDPMLFLFCLISFILGGVQEVSCHLETMHAR